MQPLQETISGAYGLPRAVKFHIPGATYPGVPCRVEPPEASSTRSLIPKSARLTCHILGECGWIRILCSIEVSLNTLLLCETTLPGASGHDEQGYFDVSYRDLLGPGT